LLEPACHQNLNLIVSWSAEPSPSRTHPVNLPGLMPNKAPGLMILPVSIDKAPAPAGRILSASGY
jgi:hypothetical protein